MKSPHLNAALCAVVFIFISMPSHAALISVLGGQAYYDDVADLTWLANANAAGTAMTWETADIWAAGLDIDGVTGWRLPDTLQSGSSCGRQSGGVSDGYNCTGREMANLFYNVLGGETGQSITMTHNSNYDLFSNIQSSIYWSGLEYARNTGNARNFLFVNGFRTSDVKNGKHYAWAVHSGDVGAANIPVPAAVWLFSSGFLGLIGVARQSGS